LMGGRTPPRMNARPTRNATPGARRSWSALWANVEFFAEHCDKVIATIREHGREAGVAGSPPRSVVLNTSDDGPFGRQPAPRQPPRRCRTTSTARCWRRVSSGRGTNRRRREHARRSPRARGYSGGRGLAPSLAWPVR
jgi:hypothetical protein